MRSGWHRKKVWGWGRAVGGEAEVLCPQSQEEIAQAFSESHGSCGLALRGAGCSYGDAATNSGGRLLDLRSMRNIIDFDPDAGTMRVQPGVTIGDVWRRSIVEGYWPAVVPGTMEVSIGGAAAMNIHGKNNFAVGSFGEHIEEFTLLTPSGELLHCDRQRNHELFYAAIGGFGMLGCFIEITLRLKKVHSGRLRVWSIPTRDLDDGLRLLEDLQSQADYLVGWLDLHARGAGLGRGLLHRADQLAAGEDPEGEAMLSPERQDLPGLILGCVPKAWIWPGMWLANRCGMIPAINAMRYRSGYKQAWDSPHLDSHAAFHFLLDYVPRWHWAFRPGGLIQFQPFLAKQDASRLLRTLIEACQRKRIIPYLGVLKRHRSDPFLMTHGLDGYSLAMDFAVPTSSRRRIELWRHCREMAELVLSAGGRFYYAKDATLWADCLSRVHGEAVVQRFLDLKAEVDPRGLLQSDLWRRISAPGSSR